MAIVRHRKSAVPGRIPIASDMTFGEIVEFLKSKGKVTTGIKDVKTWIGTLKC